VTTLCIHVGYPKTATTTLQMHLFPAHPDVDYLGKTYPPLPTRDEALSRMLDRLMTVDDTRYEGVDGLKAIIERYRRGCERKTLLMSNEGFLHLTCCDLGVVAQRIKSAFFPCKIAITIREQLDIIGSFYADYGRFGRFLFLGAKPYSQQLRFPLTLEEWLTYATRHYGAYNKNFLSLLHYRDVIRHYCKLFGRENVGVFLFEEFVQDPASFVGKLAAFMGIEAGEALKLVQGRHENKRPSERDLYYDRAIARVVPSGARGAAAMRFTKFLEKSLRKRVSEMIRAFGQKSETSNRLEIPEAWSKELRDTYRDGNRGLATEFSLPLAQYGYPL
jgi:hypothetical protein